MKKNYTSVFAAILILVVLYAIFYLRMPQSYDKTEAPLSEFSTKRALEKLKIISKNAHYVGSVNHEEVAQYVQKELQKLGLETSLQEGFTLTEKGTLVNSKNILVRIKGTDSSKKALLLLSHYDSAPHSFSHGASDDGSGVVIILEGVRAFLNNKTTHKNDIIILFSDAEELGLNGAALFVTQHNWAKEVGLAINFEARGSAGPSYMLMETNGGNAALLNGFTKANPQYPVSNSLMYSIYKMLPNDTDLTVFREQGNIPGFNFAFIDNHFNYHTQQDDYEHLDPNTLAHQGTYLMPLLHYFANADLQKLDSKQDFIYFNSPLGFVTYPFDWVFGMWVVAFVLFLVILFIGFGKRIFSFSEILKGFVPLVTSLLITGLLVFFGWKALLKLYPQYNDILHGFTYNGHDYMIGFVLLSLSICFLMYQNFSTKKATMSHFVASLFLWLAINLAIALKLKGAGFMILPVFSGLVSLLLFVITQRSNWFLNLIFAVPTLLIIAPFIEMFPIGLGLKILFVSAILTVLAFSLILPVFGAFSRKGLWSFLLFAFAIGFFINAHNNSGYEKGKALPNSLLYILDMDNNKAAWATYDTNLDEFTKGYLGENPKKANTLNDNVLYSKYHSEFTFMNDAPLKNIASPTIEFVRDSVANNMRYLKIKITPNRNVNRYDIFANENIDFNNFKANNATFVNQKTGKLERNGKMILKYYVVENQPLEMEFNVNAATVLDMNLIESSFDLMTNPLFSITKRKPFMMPKPFVLNDAVVIKQKIKPSVISVLKPVL